MGAITGIIFVLIRFLPASHVGCYINIKNASIFDLAISSIWKNSFLENVKYIVSHNDAENELFERHRFLCFLKNAIRKNNVILKIKFLFLYIIYYITV